MTILRTARLRAAGIVAIAACAVALAACGSSSSSTSTSSSTAAPAAAATTASTTAAASTGSAAMIGTATAHGKTYLTGTSGRAVYLWVADKGSTSSCSASCAQAWPPVTTTGAPTAGSGVTASMLGMSKRSDGTEQVTYDGHPLYYFVGDTSAGSTKGQGSDSFGAKWWLVTPSGSAITASGGSSSGGSSSGGSSGGWG